MLSIKQQMVETSAAMFTYMAVIHVHVALGYMHTCMFVDLSDICIMYIDGSSCYSTYIITYPHRLLYYIHV